MDKPILRKLMIEKRHQYHQSDKENSNNIIFNKIKSHLEQYNDIASYYNFPDEVDTYAINSWILESGKNLYLPKVIDGSIKFIKVNSLNDVKEGFFGVNEPTGTQVVELEDIQCVIVPMVAFNSDNYRLGFGKSFYDRALVGYKGFKLGIAYHFQRTRELVVDKHDIPLDIIVTDS